MLDADTDPESLAGLEIVDRRGERIGRVRQVYRDGGRAGWVGVRGNLLGTAEVLVPLDGAVLDEDVIGVPLSRERVRTAPRREPDQDLSRDESDRLRAFYAAPEAEAAASPTASPAAAGSAEDDAAAMTRSEERLKVGTEQVPRTRVRLVKVVVTEEQTITVPVRREEVRVVREPILDGEPGGTIGEAETELVLHEERVVVTTEVVPVERVRLVREQVTEQRAVSRPVRKERIEFEDGAPAPAPAAEEPAPAAETVVAAAPVPAPRPRRPRKPLPDQDRSNASASAT